MQVNDTFKDRLRKAMNNKGISVNELSEKTGLNTTTIYLYLKPYKYKRGSCLGANNLEALADVLGVSMDWLWGRDTEEGDKWDHLMMYLDDLELTYSFGMPEADPMKYNLIHAIKCELEGWE